MRNVLYNELKKTGAEVKKNFSVKKHTTFKIGGKAPFYIVAKDEQQVCGVIRLLERHKKLYMAAGWLSNVVVYGGQLKNSFIKLGGGFSKIGIIGKNRARIGAAVSDGAMTSFFVKNGLGGLEFMAGIPGTLGGAIYMNAGAFGKGIGEYVERIYAVDRKGNYKVIKNRPGIFSYRHSMFQDKKHVILGADIRLKKEKSSVIAKKVNEIVKKRKMKHPLDFASAGSFFKNPEGISAGALIEKAGLKGKSCGGAQVSEKHANFIINRGNARFNDVVRLASLVKKEVYRKFGIKLKEEVRYIR